MNSYEAVNNKENGPTRDPVDVSLLMTVGEGPVSETILQYLPAMRQSSRLKDEEKHHHQSKYDKPHGCADSRGQFSGQYISQKGHEDQHAFVQDFDKNGAQDSTQDGPHALR